MFSSVKNFFITFLLAVIVFGLIAYMVVGLVLRNLNGSIGRQDGDESGPDESGGGEEEIVTPYGDGGESFNVLLIGSDYRPSVFADYDPEKVKMLYGILPEEKELKPTDLSGLYASPAPSPTTRSDGSTSGNITVDENGGLVIPGGFHTGEYRVIEADTLVLLRFDKERGHWSMTTFPTDAYTTVNDRYVKLSEVYGEYGLEVLDDRIHAMTGITVDRHVTLTTEGFVRLINYLGGLEFYVPCDMDYDDYAGDVHIHLKAGRQQLWGDEALQMLMFNTYTDKSNTRQTTTAAFIKALVSAFANLDNFKRSGTIFANVNRFILTDLTVSDFTSNVGLVFRNAEHEIDLGVVTRREERGGETITVIDVEKTIAAFSQYRKLYD